jgi:hypothetical protein
MRNFWINSNIDGRQTELAGGPRSKDGEMSTALYVKSKGSSVKALSVDCIPSDNGDLLVKVKLCNDELIRVVVDNSSNKGDIIVKNNVKSSISDVINNADLTPAKKLKAIKELL